MEQWECKVLAWVCKGGEMCWTEDGKQLEWIDGSASWVVEYLNELGLLGWEPVTVTNMLDPQTGMKGPAYFLKRRKRVVKEKVEAHDCVKVEEDVKAREDVKEVAPKLTLDNGKRLRLYVTGLSFEEDDLSLAEIFRDLPVVSARIVRYRNGKSRGFGFVELEGHANVEKALAKHGLEVNSRKLHVEMSKDETPSKTLPLRPECLFSHNVKVEFGK
jgi:hypothetical protein